MWGSTIRTTLYLLYTSLCTGELNVIRRHKCFSCSPFYERACRWAMLGESKPKGPKINPSNQSCITQTSAMLNEQRITEGLIPCRGYSRTRTRTALQSSGRASPARPQGPTVGFYGSTAQGFYGSTALRSYSRASPHRASKISSPVRFVRKVWGAFFRSFRF